jgi:hypothetical protein
VQRSEGWGGHALITENKVRTRLGLKRQEKIEFSPLTEMPMS